MLAIQPSKTSLVEGFERDGYAIVHDLFNESEIEAMRDALLSETIYAEQQEQGAAARAVHLLDLSARHPAFLQLAGDERILQYIRPLIGNDIQLQHSKICTKPPKRDAGPYAMHQDFAFFPHTNTDLVAVMVYLDDTNTDNGCLQMIPGSHRAGLLGHDRGGYFAGCCDAPLAHSTPVHVEVPAGSISIHHCLTLHGSPPNRSGRPRRCIVYQYRADDAHQLADHVYADTGLLVSGKRQGRVRCTIQDIVLPRFRQPRSNLGYHHGSAWHQMGTFAQQQQTNKETIQ